MILINKLNNLIANGETAIKIAKIADKSAPSISRFINGNHIIDIKSALKIIKYYFPCNENKIMENFCEMMDRKNGRTAIEYSMVNGLSSLTKRLLQKLKESNNRTDNEWSKLYHLELMRNENQANGMDLLNKIYKVKADSIEMRVYSLILSSYCYFDLKQFDLIRRNLIEAEYHIAQINDDYIRESYQIRLGQVITVISLSQNNIDDCRKYGLNVIKNDLFSAITGPVYHALGNSYLFEDYNKAIFYLEKAKQIFIERNRLSQVQEVDNSIHFTQIFHGVVPSFIRADNVTQDKHTRVFYFIMKGNKKEALSLLETIDVDELPEYTKGFFYYYKGKLMENEDYFYESIYYFKKSGEVFYRQLPCLELQKLGVSPFALKALCL